jgi:hypothetical protein
MAFGPKKLASTAPVAVPSLESLSPEYSRLHQRGRELRSDLVAVDQELARLAASSRFITDAVRVAALVDGLDSTPVDNSADLRNDLLQKRQDLLAAIELLRNRVAQERISASGKAWQQLGPVHREKVGTLCRALIAALRAQRDLHYFRGAINDADLAWSGQPQFLADLVLGDPLDVQSHVRRLLSEAARDGFISKDVAYV